MILLLQDRHTSLVELHGHPLQIFQAVVHEGDLLHARMAFAAQVGKGDLMVLVGVAGHEYHASTVTTTIARVGDDETEPAGIKQAQCVRIECWNANMAKATLRECHGF
ncbi:hypothetical protein D3C80_1613340 [compost metagenome]